MTSDRLAIIGDVGGHLLSLSEQLLAPAWMLTRERSRMIW